MTTDIYKTLARGLLIVLAMTASMTFGYGKTVQTRIPELKAASDPAVPAASRNTRIESMVTTPVDRSSTAITAPSGSILLTSGVPAARTLPAAAVPSLFTGDYGYRITVPAGATQLRISLTSAPVDVSVGLYARFGQDVGLSATGIALADYTSNGTGDRTINVTSPPAGTYYIAVGVFSLNLAITTTVTATTTTASATSNTIIVPHFVSGAGWTTSLYLTNTSTAAENYTVKFFGTEGSVRRVAIEGMAPLDTIAAALAPGQTVVYETSITPALESGWASVTPASSASGTSHITGFAVFRYRTAGMPDTEAIVSLGNTQDRSLVLLYDQFNGFLAGVAVANPNSSALSLSITLRDQNGSNIGVDTITLPAFGHQAFFLSDRYAATINRRGSLLITGSAGFATLGLRVSPFGPITSFPPLK